ncbi:hypothetical protein FHW89_003854 [Mucilaginibacter sp. SG564]|nr:hypothetical protein [Mucilaginibacter sp. SG564]
MVDGKILIQYSKLTQHEKNDIYTYCLTYNDAGNQFL